MKQIYYLILLSLALPSTSFSSGIPNVNIQLMSTEEYVRYLVAREAVNENIISDEEMQTLLTGTTQSSKTERAARKSHPASTQETVSVTVTAISQTSPESYDIEVKLEGAGINVSIPVAVKKGPEAEGRWLFRIFTGYYTDTSLHRIVRGQINVHEEKTGLTGLEVGYIIFENFSGWPVDVVATIGTALHDDKEFQDDFLSFTAAIKLQYTSFPWNHIVRTRMEFAQGANYVQDIPYYEDIHIRGKNDGRASHLLNYLGVGVGFNAGDILRSPALSHCQIGFYVYHRSGVFGKVALYNNINGGSNFNTLFFECRQRKRR